MKTYNDAILERYGTFLVSPPESLQFADHSPFGVAIDWHINPLQMKAAGFLDLLQKLDGLTFGPEGMPMDKWVFYDCSELPGFIYGFAVPHTELTQEERTFYRLPDDYKGPVPLSMYIAIPMHESGTWFGHNLASLNRQIPKRELHHLGTITKSLAMKAYRVERLVGVLAQELEHALARLALVGHGERGLVDARARVQQHLDDGAHGGGGREA